MAFLLYSFILIILGLVRLCFFSSRFWLFIQHTVDSSPPKWLQGFKPQSSPGTFHHSSTPPTVFKPPVALAEPTEPLVPLRVPGTAGTAETGVVRVGAKSGVNYQLTVGEIRLVHAVWWYISACITHSGISQTRVSFLHWWKAKAVLAKSVFMLFYYCYLI